MIMLTQVMAGSVRLAAHLQPILYANIVTNQYSKDLDAALVSDENEVRMVKDSASSL